MPSPGFPTTRVKPPRGIRLGQGKDFFHDIDQFTNVAGPVVAGQGPEKFRIKPFGGHALPFTDAIQVIHGNVLDIFGMLPQRRDFNGQGAEAV